MSFRPHKFGRYIIVDPIAVGGMAEIYRARIAAAKEGPDRILVIKKVISNLSQNSEFIAMFEEEIKITVGLTHPNIIQIYDYGKEDNQYFMAMEYVEGKNLRQFVKRLIDMKSMFSIDMSCHIISQICQSLAYAHAYKDRMSGKPLGIVHRDISPQNIMISYDGAVKLFDFGIAKARSASDATRAGVIKGKPSYLSPEQINGEELDGKCDIFALGIVLWELLTAKRLFVAETDMGVLRLIQSAKIEPPSTFNPAVPAALNSIALKALSRDKTKRYQTAEEFQRDLHKFLYSFNPNFNPADLSYYAQEIFKQEIREDRDRLQKFLAMDPVEDDAEVAEKKPKKSTAIASKMAEGLLSTTDFNRELMETVYKDQTDSNEKTARNDGTPGLELMNKKGGNVEVASIRSLHGKSKLINRPDSKLSSLASQSNLQTPGRKSANDNNMVIPPWSKQGVRGSRITVGKSGATSSSRDIHGDEKSNGFGTVILLLLFAAGTVFTCRQMGLLAGTPLEFLGGPQRKIASSEAPVVEPSSEKDAPEKNGGRQAETPVQKPPSANASESNVLFSPEPADISGYSVAVDGSQVFVNNNQIAVPAGKLLEIVVTKAGYETLNIKMDPIPARENKKWPLFFKRSAATAPAGPMGTVKLLTTPDNAEVTFVSKADGKELTTFTPFEKQMPVGKYSVKFKGFNHPMEIDVEEGRLTRKDENLYDTK